MSDVFHESDIAFLADNGFNFSCIFYSFESLQYPEFPKDKKLVEIGLGKGRLMHWLVAGDVQAFHEPGNCTLHWDAKEVFTSDVVYTAEKLYTDVIKPMRDIARSTMWASW